MKTLLFLSIGTLNTLVAIAYIMQSFFNVTAFNIGIIVFNVIGAIWMFAIVWAITTDEKSNAKN